VFGETRSDGTDVPSHRITKHCCGLSVIGSSGPRLPWAVFSPPSMLTRPLLTSATQMPQVLLSLATLPLISWLTLLTTMP
jgi:hypothetical protein